MKGGPARDPCRAPCGRRHSWRLRQRREGQSSRAPQWAKWVHHPDPSVGRLLSQGPPACHPVQAAGPASAPTETEPSPDKAQEPLAERDGRLKTKTKPVKEAPPPRAVPGLGERKGRQLSSGRTTATKVGAPPPPPPHSV